VNARLHFIESVGKENNTGQMWRYMSVIPALRRQRQQGQPVLQIETLSPTQSPGMTTPVSTDPSTSLRSWNPVGSCSFLSLPNLPPQECTFCFASWQPSLLGLPAVSPKDCPSRAGSMAQVIENLPSKCKALSSSPPTKTPKKVHLHFALH
jgi:hypothetical protein